MASRSTKRARRCIELAVSAFASHGATPVTGNVLVRLVNAGLRMHVPSIVGSQPRPPSLRRAQPQHRSPDSRLIAEDGNPLPGLPRVQSEVFMAAGKTYDVMINVPAAGVTALPIFDRELSLSGNAIASRRRHAGLHQRQRRCTAGRRRSAVAAVTANADTYNAVIAGQTLTVSDPAKGVIANDINVYGVKVVRYRASRT